jgi:hypothetical protein
MAIASKSFVFVEVLDPEVVALLSSLRTILSDKIINTSIHITLRGPYRSDAIWNFFDRISTDQITDPIFFHGFGKFENGEQSIVYLKAHSEIFERFSYKPDFPKRVFGSNPHVTIYEGKNKQKSDAVLQFLKKEKIYFICKKYQFTPFISKQLELEFFQRSSYGEANFSTLIQQGKVESGILGRARKLADLYE